MVNALHSTGNGKDAATSIGRFPSQARARLVNRGRDTQLTFIDGSTILLMGVRRVEAVFSGSGIASKAAPVRR